MRDFNLRVPDSWRMHSDTDIITYVPRGLGYAHVGVGVKFAGGGRLIVGLFGERRCDVDVSCICADGEVRLHQSEGLPAVDRVCTSSFFRARAREPNTVECRVSLSPAAA